jgi:hypothetical protein
MKKFCTINYINEIEKWVCPTHPKETLVAPLLEFVEELPISVYVKRSETK